MGDLKGPTQQLASTIPKEISCTHYKFGTLT